MGEKGTAFAKGGGGCLVAFAVVAVFTLLLGGNVYIDFGGAILLFIIGGVIGLIVLSVYKKGKRDADHDDLSGFHQ